MSSNFNLRRPTHHDRSCRDDRYLLVDDTDEDATELLTVITDGWFDPRSHAARLGAGF